ncbi:hypothetical protein ABTY96_38645 [Streptomyces sp. NPDC096057]
MVAARRVGSAANAALRRVDSAANAGPRRAASSWVAPSQAGSC